MKLILFVCFHFFYKSGVAKNVLFQKMFEKVVQRSVVGGIGVVSGRGNVHCGGGFVFRV